MPKNYPRNMIGYGSKNFKVVWPNKARLALQIVPVSYTHLRAHET